MTGRLRSSTYGVGSAWDGWRGADSRVGDLTANLGPSVTLNTDTLSVGGRRQSTGVDTAVVSGTRIPELSPRPGACHCTTQTISRCRSWSSFPCCKYTIGRCGVNLVFTYMGVSKLTPGCVRGTLPAAFVPRFGDDGAPLRWLRPTVQRGPHRCSHAAS